MKKEIPPAAIAAAIVLVLLLIGGVAYKVFGGNPAANSASPEQVKAIQAMRSKVMSAHRDANGHFVDDNGNPVSLSAAPTHP